MGLKANITPDPIKEVEDPIKEVEDPIKEVEDPIKEVEDPIKEVEDPIKEVEDPIKEVEDPIKEVEDPIKEVEDPIKEVEDPIKEVEDPIKEVEDPIKEVEYYSASFSAIGKYNTVNVKELMKDVDERQAYNLKKASGNFISADICIIGNKEDSDPTILINPSILYAISKEELQTRVGKITASTVKTSTEVEAAVAVKDATDKIEEIKVGDKEEATSTFSVIGRFGAINVISLDKDLEQYGGLFKRITEDLLSADFCIIDPNQAIEPIIFMNPVILDTLSEEEAQSRLEKLEQSIIRAKK